MKLEKIFDLFRCIVYGQKKSFLSLYTQKIAVPLKYWKSEIQLTKKNRVYS